MINLATAYHDRLADGDLRPDAAQEAALVVLQDFAAELAGYKPRPAGLLRRFFSDTTAPRGLYLLARSDAANRC